MFGNVKMGKGIQHYSLGQSYAVFFGQDYSVGIFPHFCLVEPQEVRLSANLVCRFFLLTQQY